MRLQRFSELNVTPLDVVVIRVTVPINGHYEFLFFIDSITKSMQDVQSIYGSPYWELNRKEKRTINAEEIVGARIITRDQYSNAWLHRLVIERNQFEDKLKALETKTT